MTGQTLIEIVEDNLAGFEITSLLDEHLREMLEITPPGSAHVMNLNALRSPAITVWSAWRGNALMGCGALKALNACGGEIKAMHTAHSHRGQGVAKAMLTHIIAEAEQRHYSHLYIETGALPAFFPARNLYARNGFDFCPPFDTYREDPNSVFMCKVLHG